MRYLTLTMGATQRKAIFCSGSLTLEMTKVKFAGLSDHGLAE